MIPLDRDPSSPALAYIALGSNLDNPHRQLQRAATKLETLGQLKARSSLYRTTPVGGPPGQPDYLNAVIALQPSPPFGTPERLLAELLCIEKEQGRERRVRWQARTLDLDLLAWGNLVYRSERLQLPHPRMMSRAFVLAPLGEINPAWRHPQLGIGACETLAGLAQQGQGGGVERTSLSWH